MASRDPIATLDELLIEDPYGPSTDEAMAVAGDLLQARGEARGELIVLEQGLARASDRDTQIARRADLEGWIDQHETLVFGSLAWLRKRPSTLRYELRGGRLRRLYVDARRATKRGASTDIADLMHAIVGAPVLRRLTDLHVRVRHEVDAAAALAAIERAGRKLPLESLVVSPTTRPLDHQSRGHAVEMRKHFPHLWLVTRFARLAPLLDPELPDQTSAIELSAFADAPMSQELRIRIGRGLTSAREHTTKVACELIAGLGESARVFAPTLDLLLRPRVSHAAVWVLPALPSFGPWARTLASRLATITGDVERYPAKVRALAGKSLHDLGLEMTRPGLLS
jgi:hypothetical protein